MQEAKNYNRHLLSLIMSYAKYDDFIVDFGAGSGTFTMPLKVCGHSVTCVETDPLLSVALLKQGLIVLSSLDLIEDNSIDFLYSLNVLEHINDDEDAVKLWFKKIRPGGRLFVYVPAFQSLYSSMDKKVGHFRRYTKKTLKKNLQGAGFEIHELNYVDSLGFFASMLYKFFDNNRGDINVEALKIYDKWIFPSSRLLDLVAGNFFGKNIYAYAVKKG